MKIRSFGILAAAAFSLATSNVSYGHEFVKAGASSYGKGTAHGEGGIYTHGPFLAKGGTYASNGTGGAYGNGTGGASGNGASYTNGGARNGGSKPANGVTHANGDKPANGHAHDKGGAYGNGGAYGSSNGASGGSKHDTGGAYGNGVATNGGTYGNDKPHANSDSYGDGKHDHDDKDDHDAHTKGGGHFAVLLGGSEVSDEGKANVGDPKGRGTATVTVDPRAGKLCYAVIVDGIDAPVAAHVHQAPAGQNGPVVVPLNAPNSGDPGTASGCVDNIDSKLLRSIQQKPWSFYVNVHTGLYPNGAVRGQLF